MFVAPFKNDNSSRESYRIVKVLINHLLLQPALSKNDRKDLRLLRSECNSIKQMNAWLQNDLNCDEPADLLELILTVNQNYGQNSLLVTNDANIITISTATNDAATATAANDKVTPSSVKDIYQYIEWMDHLGALTAAATATATAANDDAAAAAAATATAANDKVIFDDDDALMKIHCPDDDDPSDSVNAVTKLSVNADVNVDSAEDKFNNVNNSDTDIALDVFEPFDEVTVDTIGITAINVDEQTPARDSVLCRDSRVFRSVIDEKTQACYTEVTLVNQDAFTPGTDVPINDAETPFVSSICEVDHIIMTNKDAPLNATDNITPLDATDAITPLDDTDDFTPLDEDAFDNVDFTAAANANAVKDGLTLNKDAPLNSTDDITPLDATNDFTPLDPGTDVPIYAAETNDVQRKRIGITETNDVQRKRIGMGQMNHVQRTRIGMGQINHVKSGTGHMDRLPPKEPPPKEPPPQQFLSVVDVQIYQCVNDGHVQIYQCVNDGQNRYFVHENDGDADINISKDQKISIDEKEWSVEFVDPQHLPQSNDLSQWNLTSLAALKDAQGYCNLGYLHSNELKAVKLNLMPLVKPNDLPSNRPNKLYSNKPSKLPSGEHSILISDDPLLFPSNEPVLPPWDKPSVSPSRELSVLPSEEFSVFLSSESNVLPSNEHSVLPSEEPPSEEPSVLPSDKPSVLPSDEPSFFLLTSQASYQSN
eukprot:scaffold1928_cov165-Chaetoceros_neogracile.AAC.2